ncbi:glutamine synthetase III family protein [Parasporobacterium paucivorans]|nr:glutamine synthetase III [Parasporobacterium paucivorans]
MKNKLTEEFGEYVFNDNVMQERLPSDIYATVRNSITMGRHFDKDVAGVVANAMKQWAIEKGATHYTHWFQPLTGTTAEKHDAFLSPDKEGKPLTRFSGKELVRGEPDASSFPSGGLRSTFEARGYTTWDPSSYAFVRGTSLYVPSAFVSYSGEALDEKTPLLRSMETLNTQAMRILRLFGNTTSSNVIATVGAEQEYFLVDEKMFSQRPDLYNCNRTLLGARSPKGQELEDHYFGSISPKVLAFMEDLDAELWKLGVFSKTRHNEVAPCQHELAPVFSMCNVAADQNQLTMDVLRTTAVKHGFRCLLHEKPYAGVNGSGKHNNWALGTNDGFNLLDPGCTPAENTQFLVFLMAVIKAVDEHQDILRASVANAANDHRLGAQEAPPAIISIFLGEELTAVLNDFENGTIYQGKSTDFLTKYAQVLPHITRDTTDRNRTSPFAFTGNKFEFRMPGSNQSISTPNTMLNTAVADALMEYADLLEKSEDPVAAAVRLIKDEITAHKRILFNGNNYSEEWSAEAERRGLLNLKTAVDAIPVYKDPKNIELLKKHRIFQKNEMVARADVALENYVHTIHIEALTMVDMIHQSIIPAVISYQNDLLSVLRAKKELSLDLDSSMETLLLEKIGKLTPVLMQSIQTIENLLADDHSHESVLNHAAYYRDNLIPEMKVLRDAADKLELISKESYWPFPSYSRMMHGIR